MTEEATPPITGSAGGPATPETPLERLGRISAEAEGAGKAARAASLTIGDLTQELRDERLWRKQARRSNRRLWIAVGFLAVLLAGTVVAAVATFDRYGTLIDRVAVDPRSCSRPAAAQTLGCENHQALVAIERATSPAAQASGQATTAQLVQTVVNLIDCRTRADLADAMRVNLPATAHCPATAPSSP